MGAMGLMGVGQLDVAFAIVVGAILVAKYFRDKAPAKTPMILILGGWGVTIVGKLLGFLIGLGSASGAGIIMVLFNVVGGAALVAGLFVELAGGIPGVKMPDIGGAFSNDAPSAPTAAPPAAGPPAPGAPPQAQAPYPQQPQAQQRPPQAQQPQQRPPQQR